MAEMERQPVVFSVLGDNRHRIPAGDHAGFIEWMTVYLHGHPNMQLSRCMLHIERNEHPNFFSPNNSMIALDVDVTSDVKKGVITYF